MQIPREDALEEALLALGLESFRPGQREAIEALLEHGSLLLVAPTGGGKSLTYQLPAIILPGTTLVISPLIALMADQVQALERRGVSATYLASTVRGDEMRTRMAKLADGDYSICYVAPERLTFPVFRRLLQEIEIPLIAVDEAHCISEWGHDFRPEYLQLGELLRFLPDARVLACTATATPIVRDEIVARLGMSPDTQQHLRGFARPNLALAAAETSSGRDRARRVDECLQRALGGPGQARGCAILYSPTRKLSEAEAARLAEGGWRSAAYHAGLSATRRQKVGSAFTHAKLEIVVATNAFGMGIDRPDVRAVIHLGPPGSVEAYYQEVGRAGRDGEPAFGLLLTSSKDMPLRRRLLEAPDEHGERPEAAVVEHKWNLFLELMRWAEGGSCRHDAILRYFGDEAEVLEGCGVCDVCTRLEDPSERDPAEVELVVRKALSGVARVHRRFGLQAAVKLLRGEVDERLSRAGLDETKTFGVLAEHEASWLTTLLRRCVTAGWVSFTTDRHPMLLLTEEGKAVMMGRRGARILLPDFESHRPRRRDRGKSATGAGAAAMVELDPLGETVFDTLRGHRLEVAQRENIRAFMVASDRTLRELAMLRPTTRDDLTLAHGIGPTKAERYGEGLLSAIADGVSRHQSVEV